MIDVFISSDPATIGNATKEDLEQYRSNLESKLRSEFNNEEIVVRLDSVLEHKVLGQYSSEDNLVDQIKERLDILNEREWIELLG